MMFKDKNEAVEVEVGLLRELVMASVKTATNRFNTRDEMYVLGQQEATANLARIFSICKQDKDLSCICQLAASSAVGRRLEILQAIQPAKQGMAAQ